MPKRLTPQEAYQKAREAHGGIYEYPNEGEYKNLSTPVLIRCQHGHEFRQPLRNHIYGKQGCPYCAGVAPLTKEIFRNKAQKIHGDKFDYSLVDYKNNRTKVEIICRKCGCHFTQEPSNHLQGAGCPECAKKHLGEKQTKTFEDFVADARKVHGNKYTYIEETYKNGHTKMTIVCPEHGEFEQRPNCHLRGQGCPQCKGDALKKLVYGVGINDTYGKERNAKIYDIWSSMLNRCYGKGRTKHPTYKDCSVCDEWLTFSSYQKWYNENCYKDFAVDKDILFKGNKIYSPETCCFVPQEINNILLKSQKARRNLPIGVRKKGNKFYAVVSKVKNGIINRTTIGYFHTPEEAFYAYKTAKEAYIKEVAQEYYDRGEITKRVYDALMRYEVEITD